MAGPPYKGHLGFSIGPLQEFTAKFESHILTVDEWLVGIRTIMSYPLILKINRHSSPGSQQPRPILNRNGFHPPMCLLSNHAPCKCEEILSQWQDTGSSFPLALHDLCIMHEMMEVGQAPWINLIHSIHGMKFSIRSCHKQH